MTSSNSLAMTEYSPSGGVRGGLLSIIMNKKAYITPVIEVMNVEVEEMIATSGVLGVTIDEAGEEEVTTDSRGRRGTWGNLWEN